MKQITVWIKKPDGWEILYQTLYPIRVELDEVDEEASQIKAILFDPNAPDTDEVPEELPRLVLAG